MKTYLMIVGLILGITGIVTLTRRVYLYWTGLRAPAVFLKWETRGLGETTYHPVVRFTARDGTAHEVTGLQGSFKKQKIKVAYTVIYLASNPAKGLIYSPFFYWLVPFAFFLLSFFSFYTAADIAK